MNLGSIVSFIAGAALAAVGILAEGITFGTSTSLVVMGVSMMASAVISATTPAPGTVSSGQTQLNAGTTIQLQPQTSNKLPTIYGTAFVGGVITDLSITTNNQDLYFVISLCEVTNNGSDSITIGDIYYQGKKCVFSGANVTGLIDPSTGLTDTSCNGYLSIYTYGNGSNSPLNSSISAITLMQSTGLTYTWNSSKKMTNTVFAIVHLTYNQGAQTTALGQTQFQIINPRNSAGDVIYDYLTSTVYGAAIPASQIDTTSLTALNTYCNQTITFTPYTGGSATQPRFKFNGVIDNKSNILSTLQDITSSCDCLLKYNEIYGIWSVIVQTPTYSVAMDINDSNITGAISIQTMDISNVYNIAQCQYPDLTLNSAFNTATVDLSIIAPSLLYPNEPTNSQTIKLPLVNNNVQAQLLATRFLKAARLDLSVKATVNYIGLELEAGDIVTVTNANYGWTAKLFRVMQVNQNFNPDGSITVDLNLQTYDPTIYNDISITQYTPPPNTGLSNPNVFGTLYAPTIVNSQSNAAIPSFQVQIQSSSAGVTQYAEVWYSAYSSPTISQLIFAGTTAVQPNGVPYGNSTNLPLVTLTGIPAGDWYFFTRMVNSLSTSIYSSASAKLSWRPTTFQYAQRYLSIAYATSATGTGFSSSPRGKTYYGILNTSAAVFDTTPSDYNWYPASPVFGSSGTLNYLLFCNRSNNLMSFATGNAALSAGTALFVPTDPNYDPTIWQGLPDGYNIIDLNARTGQLIQTGTTSVGTGEISITNNPQGQVVASLAQLLSFPGGATQYTSSAATITVDQYGRIVGFNSPDSFYYTMTAFTATSGQTLFHVTRGSEYISGNCLVFRNGCLLDTSEYTDTGGSTGNVTLNVSVPLNNIVTIISMASISSLSLVTNGASGTGTTATITFAALSYVPFTIGQSITISGMTPTGYNGVKTVTACTVSSVSFASTTTGAQTISGTIVPTNTTYNSFSRNSASLSSAGSYTASGFTLISGNELLFLNGTVINAQDYNISGQTISFVNAVTGDLQIIQWSNNNLGLPNGNPSNTDIYTIVGQALYPFTYDPNAFNLYNNGILLLETVDYSVTAGSYTLAQTPTSSLNILVEQTFNRTGAV